MNWLNRFVPGHKEPVVDAKEQARIVDLEGKVAKVGAHAVQLTELVGMELFDATVKLNDVAAVIVRARSK